MLPRANPSPHLSSPALASPPAGPPPTRPALPLSAPAAPAAPTQAHCTAPPPFCVRACGAIKPCAELLLWRQRRPAAAGAGTRSWPGTPGGRSGGAAAERAPRGVWREGKGGPGWRRFRGPPLGVTMGPLRSALAAARRQRQRRRRGVFVSLYRPCCGAAAAIARRRRQGLANPLRARPPARSLSFPPPNMVGLWRRWRRRPARSATPFSFLCLYPRGRFFWPRLIFGPRPALCPPPLPRRVPPYRGWTL